MSANIFSDTLEKSSDFFSGQALTTQIIVDLRINETLQTGAVENRTYRG